MGLMSGNHGALMEVVYFWTRVMECDIARLPPVPLLTGQFVNGDENGGAAWL